MTRRSEIVCAGCGKSIKDCRRYRIEAFAEFMRVTLPAACRMLRISGSTEKDARCHGITRNVADRGAALAGEHISAIWPEVIDHDIEDISRVCADDQCSNRFIPSRPHHKFCCRRCSQRRYDRERLRRRYQTDPEYRAKRLAKVRAYQATSRKARAAWFRQWRARKKAEREESRAA